MFFLALNWTVCLRDEGETHDVEASSLFFLEIHVRSLKHLGFDFIQYVLFFVWRPSDFLCVAPESDPHLHLNPSESHLFFASFLEWRRTRRRQDKDHCLLCLSFRVSYLVVVYKNVLHECKGYDQDVWGHDANQIYTDLVSKALLVDTQQCHARQVYPFLLLSWHQPLHVYPLKCLDTVCTHEAFIREGKKVCV